MMMLNEGIRVDPASTCILCGTETEGHTIYSGLRDRLFKAPGTWNSRRCPGCGLLWLDPRPVPEDVGALYTTYYTHVDVQPVLARLRRALKNSVLVNTFGYNELRDGWLHSLFGAVLSALPPIRDRVGMGIDYLDADSRGRLLDVGCGNGLFLSRMKQLGWEVHGIDPDPLAAQIAREHYGVPVTVGNLTDQQLLKELKDSFDVVTLNHVVEHAVDPVGLLRACGRALKPKGRMVVITPNVGSLGHESAGVSWLPLDPPRHLFLFSRSTLAVCAQRAGLNIEVSRTSARSAASMWTSSRQIATTGRAAIDIDTSLRFHPWSLFFQCREEIACALGRPVGEELVMTATPQ